MTTIWADDGEREREKREVGNEKNVAAKSGGLPLMEACR
jgi:hypothetical protein